MWLENGRGILRGNCAICIQTWLQLIAMLQTFFKIVILQQKSQPTCQSVICEEGIETTKCLKDIFAALLFFSVWNYVVVYLQFVLIWNNLGLKWIYHQPPPLLPVKQNYTHFSKLTVANIGILYFWSCSTSIPTQRGLRYEGNKLGKNMLWHLLFFPALLGHGILSCGIYAFSTNCRKYFTEWNFAGIFTPPILYKR